jgi:glycosyltransferase involved in cell wall biosynthesis
LIYVCIPAHNEGRTIGVLLWKIRKVMLEFARAYEVLVLDDASSDETQDVLARYKKVLPVVTFREEQRVGYPGAVERLLREALNRSSYPKRDAAVVLQGDFTENPEHLVALVKAFEGGADVAAGNIEANGRPVPSQVKWARRIAPLVLGRAHAAAPVADPLCGFRVYRLVVLKKVFRDQPGPLLTGEGWAANLELLGLVVPHARRISESPLNLRYDMHQRPSRVKAIRTLRGLLRVRRQKWEGLERKEAD